MLYYPDTLENEIGRFLVGLQDPNTGGWPPTSPQQKIFSVRTTSVVLMSLRDSKIPIRFPQKATNFILRNERSNDGCWSELKFRRPLTSVITTSEVIRALLRFYKLDEIEDPLKKLQVMQDKDGNGWGIIKNSKGGVRTTAYALRTLLECCAYEELRALLSYERIQKGLFYIENAMNKEGGLGKEPRTAQSDVSCTALGIIVLALARQRGFEVHVEKLKSMIERLIDLRSSETWFPSREEISVNGVPVPIGDCGTPLVLLSFSLAVDLLQYPIGFLPFSIAINEVENYTENGSYRCPGINEPRVWETAGLLEALQYYKNIVLKSRHIGYEDTQTKIELVPPKKEGHFVPLEKIKFSVLNETVRKKRHLIQGLLAHRIRDGDWPAHSLDDKYSELWTSAEVLKALLEHNTIPEEYESIVERITDACIDVDGLMGWDTIRLPDKISVYVTASVGLLYLSVQNFDLVQEIINTLQHCKNSEGTWGVCKGDVINKVRPTTFALEFLLYSLESSSLRRHVDLSLVLNAVHWLTTAQNRRNNDRGWGDLSGSYPSNITATSRALFILLLAYEKNIKVDKHAVKEGLETLKRLGEEKEWVGMIEDSEIDIEGEKKRHTVGGLGAVFGLQAFCLAIRNGFMAASDKAFSECLFNLLNRITPYKAYSGSWIVPSDLGGEPFVWNSAHALKAIKILEDTWLESIGGNYVERPVWQYVVNKGKYWKYIAISSIGAIGIYITHIAGIPQRIVYGFSLLSDISKVFVGIILTIILEEAIRRLRLFDTIMRKLKTRGKTR